jgi:hypothetical protein
MTPGLFLRIGGAVLIVIGALGLSGILGSISPLGFFHPPYWINWLHFLLGITIFIISFTRYHTLQGWIVLFPAIVATVIGVLGLLFGSYFASRYNILELADPSDHIAHLVVGLVAIWAWHNRNGKTKVPVQSGILSP